MEKILPLLGVFLLGTVLGSFANVLIHRVPRGMSIATPASHCPHCRRPIKPWENIPILSFILLRGRCAGCAQPISVQYPLVELIMGGLLAALLVHFGWTVELAVYGALALFLLALSVIDIQTYRLPNRLTLAGVVAAVVMNIFLRRDFFGAAIEGALVGVGLLGFMWLVGKLLFRREGLGMGDIKLAGMIGLFVGPAHTAGMFALGVVLAAVVGLGLIIAGRKNFASKLPFGPYLATGVIVSLLFGDRLWGWYWSLTFAR